MSADSALQATFWLMIFLQILGSMDAPGRGDRKMPAPRAFLATIVIWAVLQLIADAGYDKAAKAMAGGVVLAALVLGPLGSRLANVFTNVANATAGGTQ